MLDGKMLVEEEPVVVGHLYGVGVWQGLVIVLVGALGFLFEDVRQSAVLRIKFAVSDSKKCGPLH